MSNQNTFLLRTKEKSDFNQYWYSSHTIEKVVEEIESCLAPIVNGKDENNDLFYCAFLSTPSIYFSLNSKEIFEKSLLLDYDKVFEKRCKSSMYFQYDFNHPENIPEIYKNKFRYIIVDPPFITREVWELYTIAINYLAAEGAYILCSTIQENKDMMKEILNCEPLKFMPSIPHLVYQYFFYSNYLPLNGLKDINEEIPE